MQLVKSQKKEKIEESTCDRCGRKAQTITFKAKGENIKICGQCTVELLVSFYKIHWSD